MEIPVPHTRQVEQVDEVHTSRSNSLTATLLFMISPFVALMVALKRYKASWAKNVVWFFVVFYGFTFVIIRETMDAAGKRDTLKYMMDSEITFRNFSSLIFSDETNFVDIAQPLVIFLVSLFTNDYRILFA
ncbi:MAG: hypothetical protein ACNA8K_00005, partial [Cyclonatronaceae bacterium]